MNIVELLIGYITGIASSVTAAWIVAYTKSWSTIKWLERWILRCTAKRKIREMCEILHVGENPDDKEEDIVTAEWASTIRDVYGSNERDIRIGLETIENIRGIISNEQLRVALEAVWQRVTSDEMANMRIDVVRALYKLQGEMNERGI